MILAFIFVGIPILIFALFLCDMARERALLERAGRELDKLP